MDILVNGPFLALAVGEACKVMFWPTPDSKEKPCRGNLNFCVHCTQVWLTISRRDLKHFKMVLYTQVNKYILFNFSKQINFTILLISLIHAIAGWPRMVLCSSSGIIIHNLVHSGHLLTKTNQTLDCWLYSSYNPSWGRAVGFLFVLFCLNLWGVSQIQPGTGSRKYLD